MENKKLERLEGRKLMLEENKLDLQKMKQSHDKNIIKIEDALEENRLLIRKERIIKITAKNSPFKYKIICPGCDEEYSTKKNPDADEKGDRPQCAKCGLDFPPLVIRRRNKK